jgi:hypothetical protein
MAFAQLVVGPPGTGKTTYCNHLADFLKTLGRSVLVVNLDPASESQHGFDVDVRKLISVDDVMERLQLGPNGGLMYCMEYLNDNLDWLKAQLDKSDKGYVLFDCPGQVELYTHHKAMINIVRTLERSWHYRVCTVNMIDSFMCADSANFISALLVSMSMMMHLETPHINVLSKIDLVEAYGKLAFNLEYYTEVLDLSYLLDQMADHVAFDKHRALNAALVELVQDFSLVQFHTLNVADREMLWMLTKAVDKAVGYLYSSQEEGRVELDNAVFSEQPRHTTSTYVAQDKYMAQESLLDDLVETVRQPSLPDTKASREE